MSGGYDEWSGPARVLACGVDRAVAFAREHDQDGFASAVADLDRVDGAQLTVVLGAVVRDLLERAYPDGLDGDDAEAVLRRCVAATDWDPDVDPAALVAALAGALGVSDPDEDPPARRGAVVRHGILLIADLLDAASGRLEPVLVAAVRELHRAQTVELP